MIHQILPCKERLSQILPNSSPTCSLCRTDQPESILHAIFFCKLNRDAAMYLLINCEALYELPTTLAHCSGLELIWRNRHDRKFTRLYDIRAELECLVLTLRKSRRRKLREASNIIRNILENFPVNLLSV